MRVFCAGIFWWVSRPHAVAPVGAGGQSPPDEPAPSTPAGAEAPASTPGVLDEGNSAFTSARAVLSNFLSLAALEAKRAAHAIVWIIALAWVAGVCIVAAWLALMYVLATWALSLGVMPVAAGLAVVALNAALAALLVFAALRKSRDLLFPASRRQIAGDPPARPPTT